MSVLIKGMEMPESCYYCPFADGVWQKNKRCLINGKEMPRDGRNVQQNHLTCPLIPVPPHGRLIDADELISDFEDGMEFIRSTCQNVEYKHLYCLIADGMIELMKKYRTVIPSNREGKGRRSEA